MKTKVFYWKGNNNVDDTLEKEIKAIENGKFYIQNVIITEWVHNGSMPYKAIIIALKIA